MIKIEKYNLKDFEELVVDNFHEAIDSRQISDFEDSYCEVLNETIKEECKWDEDCVSIVVALELTRWNNLYGKYGAINSMQDLAINGLKEYAYLETECFNKCRELYDEYICEGCGYCYDDCECEEEEE